MRHNRIFWIALLAWVGTTLVSCEKVLDIDDDGSARQLVLNAVPTAGQQAFVNFTYTHFFLGGDNAQPVADADLTLYVNGVPYHWNPLTDSLSASGCNYFFPYTLQEDDTLAITVKADGQTVSAQTYVPKLPDVSDVKFENYAEIFYFYLAKFALTDHADYPEYYCIKVDERDSGERYNAWKHKYDTVDTIHSTTILVPQNPKMTSLEVNPYLPTAGYNVYTRLMCTDKLLDGQTDSVRIYILRTIDTNEVAPFKHEYTLTIESVTPARFRYLLSASSASSMNSFFAEQSQPFTNVSGGLGIFAGSAKRKYMFCPDTLPPSNPFLP